jgi:hypothetical protein
MAQLFHPAMNTVTKAVPFVIFLSIAGAGWAAWVLNASSWNTSQGRFVGQKIPFSHEHHVRGLGIDCRFCHTGVETSAFAGLPPTKTCMSCHSEIWRDAPMLQPVRDSWQQSQPLRWNRVNNLPGYVFFNHSAHVQNGVGCSTCHGNVELMPLMVQSAPLTMAWCLNCHREPEKFIRPRDQVFNLDYQPPADQIEQGKVLAKQYHLLSPQMLQSCSVCHR